MSFQREKETVKVCRRGSGFFKRRSPQTFHLIFLQKVHTVYLRVRKGEGSRRTTYSLLPFAACSSIFKYRDNYIILMRSLLYSLLLQYLYRAEVSLIYIYKTICTELSKTLPQQFGFRTRLNRHLFHSHCLVGVFVCPIHSHNTKQEEKLQTACIFQRAANFPV